MPNLLRRQRRAVIDRFAGAGLLRNLPLASRRPPPDDWRNVSETDVRREERLRLNGKLTEKGTSYAALRAKLLTLARQASERVDRRHDAPVNASLRALFASNGE